MCHERWALHVVIKRQVISHYRSMYKLCAADHRVKRNPGAGQQFVEEVVERFPQQE